MEGMRKASVLHAAAGLGLLAVSAADAARSARDAAHTMRIYGATNIKRHLQQQKRDYRTGGSLAGLPHTHAGEVARRQRQAERIAVNRAARFAASQWGRNGHTDVDGLSRRGRPMLGGSHVPA